MNTHDDDLRLALDALAGVGADAARPERLLSTVRRRVRRRRAAKQVGVGATTLAVGGALAVGALRLAPRTIDPGPVGPATTPTASSTPPASEEPTATETTPPTEPTADCSAAGLSTGVYDLVLPPAARKTFDELVAAVLACDDERLIALAEQHGSNLTFGGRTAAEFWTLPAAEEHEPVYAILLKLLEHTMPGEILSTDGTGSITVWPRVFAPRWADDDRAWIEAINATGLDPALADQMRASGNGYQGWRVGIGADGTWRFFVGGH